MNACSHTALWCIFRILFCFAFVVATFPRPQLQAAPLAPCNAPSPVHGCSTTASAHLQEASASLGVLGGLWTAAFSAAVTPSGIRKVLPRAPQWLQSSVPVLWLTVGTVALLFYRRLAAPSTFLSLDHALLPSEHAPLLSAHDQQLKSPTLDSHEQQNNQAPLPPPPAAPLFTPLEEDSLLQPTLLPDAISEKVQQRESEAAEHSSEFFSHVALQEWMNILAQANTAEQRSSLAEKHRTSLSHMRNLRERQHLEHQQGKDDASLALLAREMHHLQDLKRTFALWPLILTNILTNIAPPQMQPEAFMQLHRKFGEHLLASSALWDALIALRTNFLRLSYEDVGIQLLLLYDAVQWLALHLRQNHPLAFAAGDPYLSELMAPNLLSSAHFLLSLEDNPFIRSGPLDGAHSEYFLASKIYIPINAQIFSTYDPHLRYILYIDQLFDATLSELEDLSQWIIHSSYPPLPTTTPSPLNAPPAADAALHAAAAPEGEVGHTTEELRGQSTMRQTLLRRADQLQALLPVLQKLFQTTADDTTEQRGEDDHVENFELWLSSRYIAVPGALLASPSKKAHLHLSYAQVGESLMDLAQHINTFTSLQSHSEKEHQQNILTAATDDLQQLEKMLSEAGSFLNTFQDHLSYDASGFYEDHRVTTNYKSIAQFGIFAPFHISAHASPGTSLARFYLAYFTQLIEATASQLRSAASMLPQPEQL